MKPLLELVDEQLKTKSEKFRPKTIPVDDEWDNQWFYPSMASWIDTNGNIIGSCMRAEWYKRMSFVPVPLNPERMQKIFARGTLWEGWFQRIMTEISHLRRDFKVLGWNVKYRNPDTRISGEFDGLIELDGEPVLFEMKTLGGSPYAAKEHVEGYDAWPKDSALLQVALYLNFVKGRSFKIEWKPNDYNGSNVPWLVESPDGPIKNIKRVIFFYLWGGGEKIVQYEATLNDRGELVCEGEWNGSPKFKTFPFNVDDIYTRWDELLEHLKTETLPDADYIKRYTEQEKDQLWDDHLAKTYSAWYKRKVEKAELEEQLAHADEQERQKILDRIEKVQEFMDKPNRRKPQVGEREETMWKLTTHWMCGYCGFKDQCKSDGTNCASNYKTQEIKK